MGDVCIYVAEHTDRAVGCPKRNCSSQLATKVCHSGTLVRHIHNRNQVDATEKMAINPYSALAGSVSRSGGMFNASNLAAGIEVRLQHPGAPQVTCRLTPTRDQSETAPVQVYRIAR